jgi:YjbE family integral membrane protein
LPNSSRATKSSADQEIDELDQRGWPRVRRSAEKGRALDWLLHILDPATIKSVVVQFESEMQQPAFWLAVGKIIWINVLLSGDNALVIALACRGLEPRQRLWGMILGAGAAVVLRIIFTGIVVTLMELPYLKLVGGLALIVIAAKLLVPEEEDEDGVKSASHLWAAVQIVVVADIVMSLDNVIAVAAAANGSVPLLILGLAISVPLIVAGAALIMALLNRLPILVWAGALLLGWIAGDVIATDPAIHPMLQRLFDGAVGAKLDVLLAPFGTAPRFADGGQGGEIVCGVLGAIVVLIAGSLWRWRRLRHVEQLQ